MTRRYQKVRSVVPEVLDEEPPPPLPLEEATRLAMKGSREYHNCVECKQRFYGSAIICEECRWSLR